MNVKPVVSLGERGRWVGWCRPAGEWELDGDGVHEKGVACSPVEEKVDIVSCEWLQAAVSSERRSARRKVKVSA